MIKRFKDWINKKKNLPEVKKELPEFIDINLDEFKDEVNNLLSYMLDNHPELIVNISKSGWLHPELNMDLVKFQLTINNSFNDDYDSDGYNVFDFNSIKDDFIPFINYIDDKYNILDGVVFLTDNNNIRYNTNMIDKIECNNLLRISFYVIGETIKK